MNFKIFLFTTAHFFELLRLTIESAHFNSQDVNYEIKKSKLKHLYISYFRFIARNREKVFILKYS